jgi:hypothetical protein
LSIIICVNIVLNKRANIGIIFIIHTFSFARSGHFQAKIKPLLSSQESKQINLKNPAKSFEESGNNV